jgi:FtsZ-binding cell division protein ZapB
MSNNDLLHLPVSLGEAIDKITILDIKLDKIKDNRKNDVQKEYDLLFEKLKSFIIDYTQLY